MQCAGQALVVIVHSRRAESQQSKMRPEVADEAANGLLVHNNSIYFPVSSFHLAGPVAYDIMICKLSLISFYV